MTQPAASSPALDAATASLVVDQLAVDLVALYSAAEQQLITEETNLARRALAAPDFSTRLVLLIDMRRVANRIATMLHLRSQPLAQRIAIVAAEQGQRVASRELRGLVASDQWFALADHAASAANQIALDLIDKLTAVQNRILRFPDDAYRALTAQAASALVQGRATPAQAQSQAWRDLTGRGITGFVDRRGRQWNLASYVDMAVRTAGQRAFNASHLARLTALGVQYVTVSDDGHPCPLCAPWQGKVLSIGMFPSGDVPVAGSLEQATAAGLFHPNCRHVIVSFTPGVSQPTPATPWSAEDERRYRATQHLRYLERQVRAGKYEQAAALTALDAARARRKIFARQAEIRSWVDKNDLVRRPRREQLDLGNR